MNFTEEKLNLLPSLLLPWYRISKRDLPWRNTTDPYAVWISEIMLQQTRVDTVIERYTVFLDRFPTVDSLARCEMDDLLKTWEGLGYYSRARNLKKAAEIISDTYGGQFPDDYETIRDLPGIGEYTAGAISSIAFNFPVPAVDGNVLRVLSRFLPSYEDISLPATKRYFTDLLRPVYPDDCSAFTQALMELGALVCLPNGKPLCGKCPLKERCGAAAGSSWGELPVNKKKKTNKEQELSVFLLKHDGRVALRKRQMSGLLKGMWEFPNIEGHWDDETINHIITDLGVQPLKVLLRGDFIHVFTHITWHMRVYDVICSKTVPDLVWATEKELTEIYALPTAFRKVLKKEQPEH